MEYVDSYIISDILKFMKDPVSESDYEAYFKKGDENMEKIKDLITIPELKTLHDYKLNFYLVLNTYLNRRDDYPNYVDLIKNTRLAYFPKPYIPSENKLKSLIKKLDKAIENEVYMKNELCFRGVKSSYIIDKITNAYKNGLPYNEKAYSSTTTNVNVAEGFALSENSRLVFCFNYSPKLVKGYSFKMFEDLGLFNESEILLERDIYYHLLGKEYDMYFCHVSKSPKPLSKSVRDKKFESLKNKFIKSLVPDKVEKKFIEIFKFIKQMIFLIILDYFKIGPYNDIKSVKPYDITKINISRYFKPEIYKKYFNIKLTPKKISRMKDDFLLKWHYNINLINDPRLIFQMTLFLMDEGLFLKHDKIIKTPDVCSLLNFENFLPVCKRNKKFFLKKLWSNFKNKRQIKKLLKEDSILSLSLETFDNKK